MVVVPVSLVLSLVLDAELHPAAQLQELWQFQ